MVAAHTNMNVFPLLGKEKEDLSIHVDICAERYKGLDERLTTVEKKIDEVHNTVQSVRSDLTKTLVATGGTIVVALIGCAGIIINHIK
jgi:chaperonin cofactor prefoldin